MRDDHQLARRWGLLWQGASGDASEGPYRDLVARYSETHRAYHTLEHVDECLDNLDSARHLLMRPVEVELAIWFHDAIYDPRRGDNEEQSALLAEEQLRMAGVDRAVADYTAALICLTTHEHDDLIGDAAVLCDVDLAILGAEPQRFERYDAAIRQEYAWVAESVYRIERSRVLERFLNRPHIYHTRFFSDGLEQKARRNLTQAIANYRLSE
jgi:predicted metal-dependent HD superfamily phosphohydrolase